VNSDGKIHQRVVRTRFGHAGESGNLEAHPDPEASAPSHAAQTLMLLGEGSNRNFP